MSLILNIDTSSDMCSVCLSESGVAIAEINDESGSKHASMLSSMITSMTEDKGVKLKDLSAIALSSGPGSYTGLRIGASLAKGLCYALGIPLIAIPTTQGIACQMFVQEPDKDGLYIAMIDARHGNVYMGMYDFNHISVKNDTFFILDENFSHTFACYNDKRLYFGGSGAYRAEKYINIQPGSIVDNVICAASNISALSYEHFINGNYENLTFFEPFYLKEYEPRMKVK